MKCKVALCLGTAVFVVAAGALPASAENVGGGCVGSAVSAAAHETQQEFGVGLGAYFRALGETPSQAIKTYTQDFCTAS